MAGRTKKDNWDKMAVVVSVAIPIAIAVVGWAVNASLTRSQTNLEYVRIAASVLQQESSSRELRVWATEILNDLGPIPMGGELRQGLESGEDRLPGAGAPGAPVLIDQSKFPADWVARAQVVENDDRTAAEIRDSLQTKKRLVVIAFGNSTQVADFVSRADSAAAWSSRLDLYWLKLPIEAQRIVPRDRVPGDAHGEVAIIIGEKSTAAISLEADKRYLESLFTAARMIYSEKW